MRHKAGTKPPFILCAWVGNFFNFFLLSLSSRPATISCTYRYTFLGLGFFMVVGNGFVWNWLPAVFLFSFFIIGLWIAFGAIRSFTGFSLYFIISSFYIYYFFFLFLPFSYIFFLDRALGIPTNSAYDGSDTLGTFFILQTNTLCPYVFM